MKAVLVATSGKEKKLYYVLDSRSRDSDGVLSIDDKTKVVNFWDTATSMINLVPLLTTEFHKYLWNGFSDDEDSERWERIFINKTQTIEDRILNGVTVSQDVMKTQKKSALFDSRTVEFKSLLQTQSTSKLRGISGR